MAYRILADENIERATVNYLRKLGHEVERLDDDFFAELDVETTAGVLFQRDQTLSTRDVGDAVHEMSQYLDQSDIVIEYVGSNWL